MTRIGLLSDSHGRAATTRRAVALLLDAGAEQIVHLGDVGSTDVLDALAVNAPGNGEQLPAHVVFGNSDYDVEPLDRYARDLGLTVDHPVGTLQLEPGQLVFCHGHDSRAMGAALAAGVRWLCHGHTHQASDTRQGATRIINPGALHRAAQYTVALLDTADDELTLLNVPRA